MELPSPLARLLLALVDVAERNEVYSLFCTSCQSVEESGAWDLMIRDDTRQDDVVVPRLRGSPIASLEPDRSLILRGKSKIWAPRSQLSSTCCPNLL